MVHLDFFPLSCFCFFFPSALPAAAAGASLAFRICLTSAKKHSSLLILSFALVSKNSAPIFCASARPSASDTARSLDRSHLLPQITLSRAGKRQVRDREERAREASRKATL